jgi:flagellar basal-body rod modification protein FlgD
MSTSTLPISSIAALSPTTTAPSSAVVTSLASENVFLQLLVAQLKNQDPEQPTDGTAFVTELAQFTTLQTDSQSSSDLDKIVAALPTTPMTPTAPATPTPPNTTHGINQ